MITEQTATIQLAIVDELIAHFEVESGRKPTDREVQIAYRAYELGRKMADRGYNDKQNGRDPLPISAIEAVTKLVISGTGKEDVGFANTIAKLLYENYMIGRDSNHLNASIRWILAGFRLDGIHTMM